MLPRPYANELERNYYMFVIMFIMVVFIFVFNVFQLIVYFDTLKIGLIKKLFKEDKNVSYRNKKYHIGK